MAHKPGRTRGRQASPDGIHDEIAAINKLYAEGVIGVADRQRRVSAVLDKYNVNGDLTPRGESR
jgi:hypothetical protein